MANAAQAAAIQSIKGSKRELHAEQSHKRQQERIEHRAEAAVKVTQARHKARLSEVNSRRRNAVKQAAGTSQARVAASREVMAQREAIRATHQQENVQRRVQSVNTARRDRIVNAVGTKALNTATPSGDSNLIMTTLFVMVGLVVFYLLVTSAGAFSGWMAGLGDLLHKVSSTTPLFTESKSTTSTGGN